jgi:hypothetical protein
VAHRKRQQLGGAAAAKASSHTNQSYLTVGASKSSSTSLAKAENAPNQVIYTERSVHAL